MTHDGHTTMEIFKFGTDREDIGPFVSASLTIVWPWIFLAFGSIIASDTKIFDMPKKNARRTHEGSISC